MRQLLERLRQGVPVPGSRGSAFQGSGSRGSGSSSSGSGRSSRVPRVPVRGWRSGGAVRRGGARSIATPAAAARARGLVSPALARCRGRCGRRLGFENFRPVELDVGIVFFDPADGVFVERGAADLDARRRAKPVENALPRSPVTAAGMDERGCFVPAFVAGKPQKWQSYLRLRDCPVFLAGFAAGFFAADFALAFGLPAALALRRTSAPACWTRDARSRRPSDGAL